MKVAMETTPEIDNSGILSFTEFQRILYLIALFYRVTLGNPSGKLQDLLSIYHLLSKWYFVLQIFD